MDTRDGQELLGWKHKFKLQGRSWRRIKDKQTPRMLFICMAYRAI